MMEYSQPLAWPPYLVLGATLASVGITFVLCRLRCNALLAAIVGGVAPGAAIFTLFLYLDAQPLEGVYYLWFGIPLGGLAVFFGLLAAALTAILFAQLSDDALDSN